MLRDIPANSDLIVHGVSGLLFSTPTEFITQAQAYVKAMQDNNATTLQDLSNDSNCDSSPDHSENTILSENKHEGKCPDDSAHHDKTFIFADYQRMITRAKQRVVDYHSLENEVCITIIK